MAKFKVGDRVKVKGAGVETILAVYPKGRGAGGMRLDPSVDWYGSSEGGFITDEDIDGIANSRACNAKFKPGDLAYIKKTGEVCKVLAEMPRQSGKTVYKLKIIEGPYRGEEEGLFESDLLSEAEHLRSLGTNANSAVRSRNSVVAKALNACARNVDVCNADVVPPDLWEKLRNTSLAYVITGSLHKGVSVDELIRRFRTSGPGSQIPGRTQDSAIAVSVLEEMKRRGINACGTARNATDADVARYLSAAKDRIRGEVATLKDVVGLLKMKPMPPSAEKAHEKIVKAMASLQRAFAELS